MRWRAVGCGGRAVGHAVGCGGVRWCPVLHMFNAFSTSKGVIIVRPT